MKKILTVWFLAFFCFLLKAQVPASDSLALVALYQSMNGHLWTSSSNWLQTNRTVSTWYGITVTNDTVTGINLDDNNLIGTIPADIGNFTNLQTLSLVLNDLSGSIPVEIGDLSNLQTLSLDWNDLSGNIPVEIGNLSNLQYLSLMGNELDDSILAEIGDLSNLQHLDLGYNDLRASLKTCFFDAVV